MHMDWAISRNDPVGNITNLGREIERMDREMRQIASEISLLEKQRWTLNSVVPMKSVSK